MSVKAKMSPGKIWKELGSSVDRWSRKDNVPSTLCSECFYSLQHYNP